MSVSVSGSVPTIVMTMNGDLLTVKCYLLNLIQLYLITFFHMNQISRNEGVKEMETHLASEDFVYYYPVTFCELQMERTLKNDILLSTS